MSRELITRYGQTWTISEGTGGGWYAVRRTNMSAYGLEHGLCNVRCGATVRELARNLEEETQLENQPWRRVPLIPMP
ncbi:MULTISPECIES: hypothetical protein [unclassified Streptosporangium]|uniref:hypothetical protein n=1 Tax=unclassified Streptosporangium TaxID=2632669 RepID=UPI002E2CD530|nr:MULTISPECIES: hypothetical protein [unclassified Streptosporangium]